MPSEDRADLAAHVDAMLPYRYAPRPSGGFTVVRKDLLRNLTEATLLKQLSVVRGPAGSGKTTLLAQWRGICRDMDRPVAWLTVDRADRDIARFVGGLAAAAERAGCSDIAQGFRAMPAALLHASPAHVSQYLASVCNGSDNRLAIVLDQYEEADDDAIGEILGGFLNHSVSARLVIASRTRLKFPLGSLRTRDQIFEIGPSDLNLTPLETHGLFAGMPEIYTRRLHYETSGEAVAVGFARRVMENPPRDFITTESWQDQLHEYYRTEVLDRLPPDMREAMSRLVVVERFDMSLASALIGRNATGLIERLHHSDGILLRHRGAQLFYFSEMLRRFLETRLAWLAEDEHKALHRRAAGWFAERGRHAEALRHAVEAGDHGHARGLLDRVGYANVVLQHGITAAHELFEAVGVAPEGTPLGQHLSLAVIHAHEGNIEQAARHLDEAKTASETDGELASTFADQLVLAEAIVAGFDDNSRYSDTAPALAQYLATGPKGDHENRALAQVFLSWDHFCRGDIAGAAALADDAARDYGETEAVFGATYMHIHRTLYLFWLGDLESALQEVTLAEQVTQIFFPNDYRLRAMTAVLRAGLLFELGRPDPLTDFTALVGTVGAVVQWSEIQIWSHIQGVRAALAQGADNEARGIIAYGAEVARRLNSPRMDWVVSLLSVETSLWLGEIDRAEEEAATLGLSDLVAIDSPPLFLTWQERINGALVGAQLHQRKGELDRAAAMIEAARTQLAQIGAPRLATMLGMAEAQLSQGRGDMAASHAQFAAARALYKGGLPPRPFLDGGDRLRTLEPAPPRSGVAGSHLQPPMPAAQDDPLTARERQILLLLGEGHQNKVAAHRLGLSEATVKFHLRNIYRKLHAQNRTQALARYRPFADLRPA